MVDFFNGNPPLLAVVRVFTTDDSEVLEKHSRILERVYGFRTKTYCVPDHPDGITSDEAARECAPLVARCCRQAEEDGTGAVIVSCTNDPGVELARSMVSIPVFGAGSCAAAAAVSIAGRIGVLSLVAGRMPDVPRAIIGGRLTEIRSSPGVSNTRGLLTEGGRRGAAAALMELAKSSDAVMLSCTGLSTIGIAHWFPDLPVPVIDPVEAAGARALGYFLTGGRMAAPADVPY